jgi:hypothetical protein
LDKRAMCVAFLSFAGWPQRVAASEMRRGLCLSDPCEKTFLAKSLSSLNAQAIGSFRAESNLVAPDVSPGERARQQCCSPQQVQKGRRRDAHAWVLMAGHSMCPLTAVQQREGVLLGDRGMPCLQPIFLDPSCVHLLLTRNCVRAISLLCSWRALTQQVHRLVGLVPLGKRKWMHFAYQGCKNLPYKFGLHA